MSNYCYILRNNGRTYNGFTTNPKRRIRQHNGELVGGAKSTRCKNDDKSQWEMYVLIEGFPTQINALQCEWRIKHPTGQKRRPARFCGPIGRIRGLVEVLKLSKWTTNSTIENANINLKIWIVKEFAHLLTDELFDNIGSVNIYAVDNIISCVA